MASVRQSLGDRDESSRRDSLQLHIPPGASFMEVVDNSRQASNDVSQRQFTRSLESSSYQQSTSPQPHKQTQKAEQREVASTLSNARGTSRLTGPDGKILQLNKI